MSSLVFGKSWQHISLMYYSDLVKDQGLLILCALMLLKV